MYDVLAAMLFVMATLDIIFYTGVWLKIKRTKALFKIAENEFRYPVGHSYIKTAKLLTCFVVAYLVQWFPMLLFSAWKYISEPPQFLILLIVTFCNLGGVFNFLAYTYIRTRMVRIDGRNSLSASMIDLKNAVNPSTPLNTNKDSPLYKRLSPGAQINGSPLNNSKR